MVNQDKSGVRNGPLWHSGERMQGGSLQMSEFPLNWSRYWLLRSFPFLRWQNSRAVERDCVSQKGLAQKDAASSEQLAESLALLKSHKTPALPPRARCDVPEPCSPLPGARLMGLGSAFGSKLEMLVGTRSSLASLGVEKGSGRCPGVEFLRCSASSCERLPPFTPTALVSVTKSCLHRHGAMQGQE